MMNIFCSRKSDFESARLNDSSQKSILDDVSVGNQPKISESSNCPEDENSWNFTISLHGIDYSNELIHVNISYIPFLRAALNPADHCSDFASRPLHGKDFDFVQKGIEIQQYEMVPNQL
ncbi:unnamed protein product [Caenorhabditis angaria]|uniref:Uncharacterized protein n=1 Tax=Caenorhabditis angaria TaxID=860376 RepID=A0A9P1IZ22_9PELO|nr:unnamed protein product [Caenorhabditis angaria]